MLTVIAHHSFLYVPKLGIPSCAPSAMILNRVYLVRYAQIKAYVLSAFCMDLLIEDVLKISPIAQLMGNVSLAYLLQIARFQPKRALMAFARSVMTIVLASKSPKR